MAEWLDMDEEQYEAALATSEHGTFYHTRTWARIVTASFPALEDHSGLLRTSQGLHAIPLYCWKRAGGLLRTYHSSFPFLYGGPIPSTIEAWEALGKRLRNGIVSARLMGNPFAPEFAIPESTVAQSTAEESTAAQSTAAQSTAAQSTPNVSGAAQSTANVSGAAQSTANVSGAAQSTADESAPRGGGHGAGTSPAIAAGSLGARTETTHLLDLPDSPDTYWEKVLTTQKRNDIRRLTRKGVTVETSTADEDVRQVYDFYQRRMATWSQRPGIIYPLELYKKMMSIGGEAVRLYAVRFEGRLIGGTFVCRAYGKVHYHAGYFDDEAKRLRPNVLVQERIIRDAIEDGFHRYDFLPSAGIASVERFKESFGGVRTMFPYWIRLGWLHRLAGRIRSTT